MTPSVGVGANCSICAEKQVVAVKYTALFYIVNFRIYAAMAPLRAIIPMIGYTKDQNDNIPATTKLRAVVAEDFG